MLPAHVTRELRYLEIYTARKMRSLRAGSYTSRLRGPGFDFDEHRPYRPGDDVRRIDWNVAARLHQPFVRETHAERELNVIVALDLSSSMAFGTARFDKSDVMLYAAACLAFSATIDQINLGMVAFGAEVLQFWPPRRSKGRAWRALQELWQLHSDPGPTSFGPVATFLHKRLRTASLVFLVSDFLSTTTLAELPELRLLASRHDVVAVVVQDPAETALFDAGGEMRVRDPESGLRRSLAVTGRNRRRYAAMMAERRTRQVDDFYNAGMDHAFVMDRPAADADALEAGAAAVMLEPLLELFATRRRAS